LPAVCLLSVTPGCTHSLKTCMLCHLLRHCDKNRSSTHLPVHLDVQACISSSPSMPPRSCALTLALMATTST
jgi:hypothetical protein